MLSFFSFTFIVYIFSSRVLPLFLSASLFLLSAFSSPPPSSSSLECVSCLPCLFLCSCFLPVFFFLFLCVCLQEGGLSTLAFTWGMAHHHIHEKIRQRVESTAEGNNGVHAKEKDAPMMSPIMAGGLFTISRKWSVFFVALSSVFMLHGWFSLSCFFKDISLMFSSSFSFVTLLLVLSLSLALQRFISESSSSTQAI